MEAVAKLRNYPTSPRKMRLLADLIRGQRVDLVLAELEHNPKHSSVPLRKLVLSAISNWKQKNEGGDETGLVVKTIFVDGGRTLKRMRPAPQGRGYRVRKRSNHVTVIVDVKGEDAKASKKLNLPARQAGLQLIRQKKLKTHNQ
ncbi:50S ribosomal protein L22 [Niabella hibiscisoli]|uniref:50S ribosomal protein L22 n=1 Tax=Niabella hibiscisoli TaxID=1825928 RepID=UPI001F0F6EE9|nr:50S ribosomal protein L22 [Niabella hibiscisoli]MCH5718123.1 50S ribosomal protein L22 [Niabella hibiscisoli]